jgi:hypothetical protein
MISNSLVKCKLRSMQGHPSEHDGVAYRDLWRDSLVGQRAGGHHRCTHKGYQAAHQACWAVAWEVLSQNTALDERSFLFLTFQSRDL